MVGEPIGAAHDRSGRGGPGAGGAGGLLEGEAAARPAHSCGPVVVREGEGGGEDDVRVRGEGDAIELYITVELYFSGDDSSYNE